MDISDTNDINQYLTFKLNKEVFGLSITKVREVLDLTTITKVPRSPEYMRGVINLRGNVVPVVDLHLRFGALATENTVNTCIIIVEVEINDEILVLGVLADSVQEVVELSTDQIEPVPKIGTKLNIEFIDGMGKKNDEFIILLNIDKVFSCDEIVQIKTVDNETFEDA